MPTSESPLPPQPSEPIPLQPTNVTPSGAGANDTSTNEPIPHNGGPSSAADEESVEMPLQPETEQCDVEPMLLEQESVKPDSVPLLEPVEKSSEPSDVLQPAASEQPQVDQVQIVENPKTILETLPSIDV